MTIQSTTPYLILNGHAERALALYQEAFGAQVGALQRFGDANPSCAEALKNNVMHAELKLGNTALLMLSDGPGAGALPPTGLVSIALGLDAADEARRAFEHLARTGKVIQALIDAPWGALFGIVEDELGVHWMFNCEQKPS